MVGFVQICSIVGENTHHNLGNQHSTREPLDTSFGAVLSMAIAVWLCNVRDGRFEVWGDWIALSRLNMEGLQRYSGDDGLGM